MFSVEEKRVIRSCVNLDQLSPYMMTNGLLTSDEYRYLTKSSEPTGARVDFLVREVLERKGERCRHLLLLSLKEETEHLGHRDIERVLCLWERKRKRNSPQSYISDHDLDSDTVERDMCPKHKRSKQKVSCGDFHRIYVDKGKAKLDLPSCQVLMIAGPPGVGKSHIAKTIGQSMEPEFEYEHVNLRNEPDLSKFEDWKRNNYSGNHAYCIVLDDADKVLLSCSSVTRQIVSQFCSRRPRSKLILSSCKQLNIIDSGMEFVTVYPLSHDESVLMLKNEPHCCQVTEKDLYAVAEMCGGLPLALKAASENMKDHYNFEGMLEQSNALDALYVPSYSNEQVKDRLHFSFTLLSQEQQKRMVELSKLPVRQFTKEELLSYSTTVGTWCSNIRSIQSLCHTGWLLHKMEAYCLNPLLKEFLMRHANS